jgi:hypothetical protein
MTQANTKPQTCHRQTRPIRSEDIHQLKVHGTIISWVGIIIAALILAVLPYMLLRGPVNRIARMLKR